MKDSTHSRMQVVHAFMMDSSRRHISRSNFFAGASPASGQPRGRRRRGDVTSEEDPAVAPLADLAGDLVVANHRDGHGDGRKPRRTHRRHQRGDVPDAPAAATLGEAGGLTAAGQKRTASPSVGGRADSRRGSVSGRPATRRAVALRRAGQTSDVRGASRTPRVRECARPAAARVRRRARRSAVVVVVCYSDVCFETCASSRARRRTSRAAAHNTAGTVADRPRASRVAPHLSRGAPIHLDALTPREASDLERG